LSPSLLVQKDGDTVDIFCEASGIPLPTLSWYKDGRELTPCDRVLIAGNRVRLKNIGKADAGVYTCVFKNIAGTVSHLMKLVIQGQLCLRNNCSVTLLYNCYICILLLYFFILLLKYYIIIILLLYY